MLYQLPTGKTLLLTIDQFLALTDDDEQYLIARNFGDHVPHPFFGSALHHLNDGKVDEVLILELEVLPEEDIKELYLIEDGQKFCEQEYDSELYDHDDQY